MSKELVATVCCSWHTEPRCCDLDDCGPCCPRCPTCPTLNRDRLWAGVSGGASRVERDGMSFKVVALEVRAGGHVVGSRFELDRTPGEFHHKTAKVLDRMVRSIDEQLHA